MSFSPYTIYNGTSSFKLNSGSYNGSPLTAFNFYNNDIIFQEDADNVVNFITQRLGYPLVDIELSPLQMYTAFEDAVTTYGKEVYMFQIRENMLNLEGSSTSSVLNNSLIKPNISNAIRMSHAYGEPIGIGGNVSVYSASLITYPGVQEYDLNNWALGSGSVKSGSLPLGDIYTTSSVLIGPNDFIEVRKVHYESVPSTLRYFDPLTGLGYGYDSLLNSFGFGGFSPSVSFMLMPIYFDLQRLGAIQLNDRVRKSHYSFEIANNQLKIFPPPKSSYILWLQYSKGSEIRGVQELDANGNPITGVITNTTNVPYTNPTYSNLNTISKSWIYQYSLANAKEMLSQVRGKLSSLPIPNSNITLNATSLAGEALSEKDKLITSLREQLLENGRQKQLERMGQNNDNLMKLNQDIPLWPSFR